MRERVADDWFVDLIRHVSLAGACQHWMREDPATAPGLGRIAERERRAANVLLMENLDATATNQISGRVRMPFARRGGVANDTMG